MRKTENYNDFDYTMMPHESWLYYVFNGNGPTEIEGHVKTEFGIVNCYSLPNWTHLSIVFSGRAYHRTWKTGFGRRTIVKLAKAFSIEKFNLVFGVNDENI